MITQEQAFEKLIHTIQFDLHHSYYEECQEIAEYAHKVNSSLAEDQKDEIERYRKSESREEKKQRIRVTNPMTSVPLGMVYSYWEETYRTDGIKKKALHENENIKELIDQNFKQFYQGESLHEFLHKKLLHLNRYDPNAWIIFEATINQGERGERESLTVYPLIATCSEAIDFQLNDNGKTEYLIVQFTRNDMVIQGDRIKEEEFKDYYLYGVGFNWHFAETKANAQHKIDYLAEGYEQIEIDGEFYYYQSYITGTKEVPAIRAGAYLSGYYNQKIAETPVESAKPILNDLMGEKSLFDTQKVVHIFPEAAEYVKKCNYQNDNGDYCEGGYYGGRIGNPEFQCEACKGTGKLMVTSEQQVKTFAWPDNAEDLIDLSKVKHYVERPINIIEFYEGRLDKLSHMVNLVVFNQQTLDKALVTAKTATEVNVQADKINNKLAPFAQQVARSWELGHRIAYQMYGIEDPEVEMIHPHDYKLKSVLELNKEYTEAKKAGQPYEVLWSITLDILNKQHRNSPEKVKEIAAFERWKPWKDKTPEEVFFIIQNRSNDDPMKILWENWDQIRTNIEIENTGIPFYMLSVQEQRNRIDSEIQAIQERISYQGIDSGGLIGETLNLGG